MPTLKIPIKEMSHLRGEGPVIDPRDYLAAERTFLAWLRTGLAMMGFGFVVARFGVFSQHSPSISDHPPPPADISAWCGAILVVIGIVLTMAATRHHLRLIRQFNQGRVELSKSFSIAIGAAAIFVLIGLLVALDLVMVG